MDRRAVIDTLPSGVVRVRGPANGRWTEETRWRLREELRVGRTEGGGPEVFGQAWAITSDPLGRVYVLDRQAKEVRVFDRQRNHVRTLGREGGGPGEFRNPFGMAWDGQGRLWVVDVRQARYSVFDTAGRHVREYPRRVGGFSWPWPGRFDRNGVLYEASRMGDDVQPILAFRPTEDLVAVDTFPRALADLSPGDFFDLRDDAGIGSVVQVPYGRKSAWALDADAHLWTGHSSRYALVRKSLHGDTLLLIERAAEPAPVDRAELAAAIDELGDFARHPKMELSRIPSTKPFFQSILPDDQGNLWVLREGVGDAWFFDVFAAAGEFLGAVPLPERPELYPPPRITRDLVLLVTRDSLDVQRVVRYNIVKGEAADGSVR